MAISNKKKKKKEKSWQGCGEVGTSYTLLVGMQMVQLLQKTVWSFLKILKIKPTYDPAIPPLDI